MRSVEITDPAMVEACGVIEAATAAGFDPGLPRETLAHLGFLLNDDDELWEAVDRNWQLECASGGKPSHPKVIFLSTIKAEAPCDLAALRNRILNRRAQELAE